MKSKITQLFADWTYTQPSVPSFPKVEAKPAAGVFAAAKNDVTQTFFALGQLAPQLRVRGLRKTRIRPMPMRK